MRTPLVLAKAVGLTYLALAACTPKTTAPTVSSEPINGITESIVESPVTDVRPDFVARSFSGSSPVDVGAFRTTAAQEAKIDSLLGVMTMAEKAGQMNQYTSFYDVTGPAPEQGKAAERYEQIRQGLVGSMLNVTGVAETRKLQGLALQSRLGIPLIFAFDVIHGFKTQNPVPLAEVATWDPALVQRGAEMAALEASAYGLHWTFAPMVDVSPDARWGRIVEGAGEDPYLGSVMAEARVRGFQGDDLADHTSIAACAKHFAGYGFARGGRDYNESDISDYTLHNVVLPPFRAAAEAGSATFMNGFNTVGGTPVTGNAYLQREWLKGDLGWPGFIVSDWNSIGEMVAHGVVADKTDAAELALESGSDMDMETAAFVTSIPNLVEAGEVSASEVNDAVRRVLRVKMALGLFDDPYRYSDVAREAAIRDDVRIRETNIETAARSAVLLKNGRAATDGQAAQRALLPLAKDDARRIVVIGDLAGDKDSPLGTWSLAAERNTAVSLVEAVREVTGADVRYVPGPSTLTEGTMGDFLRELDINDANRSGLTEAVAAARSADIVLLALGEPGFMSGEARSRVKLDLPGLQQELFEAVIAANPNTAVVLYTGRPLAIADVADAAPSVLCAWQPGSYGNLGIAQVLFGERDATGHLPVSFPYSVGQEPLTYREYSTGRPGPAAQPKPGDIVFNSHYMDSPRGGRFAFGHGLSYTTWMLSEPTVTPSGKDSYTVTTTVTNTGSRAGTQTVQLYLQDPVASRARPVRELKGFQQTALAPGASESLTFQLSPKHLQFWTPEEDWHVEPGTFRVWVGTSSEEVVGPVEFEVGVRP